jgi:hypothetical protein
MPRQPNDILKGCAGWFIVFVPLRPRRNPLAWVAGPFASSRHPV